MGKKVKRFRQSFLLRFLMFLSVLGMIVGGVAYAAMTVRDQKVNTFQIGNLETKIEEVFTAPATIKPGEELEKKVRIINTGTIKQFIRVMLQPEISKKVNNVDRIFPAEIGNELELDLDLAHWKAGGDGYYYYLDALKPKKATSYLFTKVKVKNNLGKEYDQGKVTLLVKVETSNTAEYVYRDAWWQGVTPTSGSLQVIDSHLKSKIK